MYHRIALYPCAAVWVVLAPDGVSSRRPRLSQQQNVMTLWWGMIANGRRQSLSTISLEQWLKRWIRVTTFALPVRCVSVNSRRCLASPTLLSMQHCRQTSCKKQFTRRGEFTSEIFIFFPAWEQRKRIFWHRLIWANSITLQKSSADRGHGNVTDSSSRV